MPATIPPRTLEQIRKALADAAKNNSEQAFARLMVKHGNLTSAAKAFAQSKA